MMELVAIYCIGFWAQPPAVEMVLVPAGRFIMGKGEHEADLPNDDHELPRHEVVLDAYEIGKHEVTNEQAASIVTWAVEQGHVAAPGDDGVFQLGTMPLLRVNSNETPLLWDGARVTLNERMMPPRGRHPLVHVTWYGAAALCNWLSEWQGLRPCYDLATWRILEADGYRLPTEAEWERAAAWDTVSRSHWTYALPVEKLEVMHANFFAWRGGGYANPLRIGAMPYTAPVGHYSMQGSPAGCFDMSGNVWEWCGDWYSPKGYQESSVVMPVGPEVGEEKVERGGSWRSDAAYCRTAYRNRDRPDFHMYDLGFRMARSTGKSDTASAAAR